MRHTEPAKRPASLCHLPPVPRRAPVKRTSRRTTPSTAACSRSRPSSADVTDPSSAGSPNSCASTQDTVRRELDRRRGMLTSAQASTSLATRWVPASLAFSLCYGPSARLPLRFACRNELTSAHSPDTALTKPSYPFPADVPVTAYCFATPAVTSAALSRRLRPKLVRSIVLGDDIVPRFSLGHMRDLRSAAAWICAAETSVVDRVFEAGKRSTEDDLELDFDEQDFVRGGVVCLPRERDALTRGAYTALVVPQDARSQYAARHALPAGSSLPSPSVAQEPAWRRLRARAVRGARARRARLRRVPPEPRRTGHGRRRTCLQADQVWLWYL